jgi:hypothetical protein
LPYRYTSFEGFEGCFCGNHIQKNFGVIPVFLNASQKFVKFSLKPGNLHDVSCAEEVLVGCTGTVIGDSEYVSATLRDSLAKKGIRLIAKHRQNMASNSREEKRFQKNGRSSRP